MRGTFFVDASVATSRSTTEFAATVDQISPRTWSRAQDMHRRSYSCVCVSAVAPRCHKLASTLISSDTPRNRPRDPPKTAICRLPYLGTAQTPWAVFELTTALNICSVSQVQHKRASMGEPATPEQNQNTCNTVDYLSRPNDDKVAAFFTLGYRRIPWKHYV